VRAYRLRQAATRSQTPPEPDVTVSRLQNSVSEGARQGLTKAEVGIAREIPPGPARLLEALVLRGLPEEHLHAAAALCLMLDEGAR
jgi:hypothetical protein